MAAFTIGCKDRILAIKDALADLEAAMVHFKILEESAAKLNGERAKLDEERRQFEAEKAAAQNKTENKNVTEADAQKAMAEDRVVAETTAWKATHDKALANKMIEERCAAHVIFKNGVDDKVTAEYFTKRGPEETNAMDSNITTTAKASTRQGQTHKQAIAKAATKKQATGAVPGNSEEVQSAQIPLHLDSMMHPPSSLTTPPFAMFSGIKRNLKISALDGWVISVCKPYEKATTIPDFECDGVPQDADVLLGARKVGDDTLMVAAIGRLDIFRAPARNHNYNGVYWTNDDRFVAFTPSPLNFYHHGTGCEHDKTVYSKQHGHSWNCPDCSIVVWDKVNYTDCNAAQGYEKIVEKIVMTRTVSAEKSEGIL